MTKIQSSLVSGHQSGEKIPGEKCHLFKRMLDLLPEITYVYDILEKKNIISNPGVTRILGYSPQEIQDMGEQVIPSLMHPEDLRIYTEETIPSYHKLDDETPLITRYRMRNKDGSWHWLEANERIFLRNDDGSPRQIVGVIHDISSARQMEDALRESEQSLKQLIAHLNAGVVIHAPDTQIIFASDKASELLGLTIDQLMGKEAIDPAWCFIREDETAMPVEEYPVARVLATLQPIKNMIRGIVRPATHDRVWVIINAFPEFHSNGEVRHAVITFIDITDRKEAELALASQKQRLYEAQQRAQRLESLGILAGGIAHDFNNLLAGMFGHVEIAMTHLEKSDITKATDALNASFDVFDRTKGLTRRLLTFARGGAPVRKKMDVTSLIEQCTRFCLSGSNVTGHLKIDSDLWCCHCDENQLGQVLDAILLNAQEAMAKGGQLVVVAKNEVISDATEMGGQRNGPHVRIAIEDEGMGIAAKDLPKIFDPFFTTKTMGHGLGLATAYSIVNRHGGWIDIKSQPGKGTTVTLFLPAEQADDALKETPKEASDARSESALIMDDEQMLLDIESTMLQGMGYQVVCARNGQDALALFKKAYENNAPFTFTILDLSVPNGMGGAEAVKEMRRIDPSAIVVVASGYAGDPIVTNPRHHGFTDKLIKPFRRRELVELLARYLN